jgi:hypothetical protein
MVPPDKTNSVHLLPRHDLLAVFVHDADVD